MGDFRDLRELIALRGAARLRHHRPESAARADAGESGAHQSVQSVEPPVPQRALHRGRGRAGVRRVRAGARARRERGVSGDAARAARDARTSTTSASPRAKFAVLQAAVRELPHASIWTQAAQRAQAFRSFVETQANRCGCMRSTMRSMRTCACKVRSTGAGRAGRRNIAIRRRRRESLRARARRRTSSTSCICNGSPTSSCATAQSDRARARHGDRSVRRRRGRREFGRLGDLVESSSVSCRALRSARRRMRSR